MVLRNVEDTKRQLRELLAAATEGPFTEEQYKQVLNIVAHDPELAYPTAALYTVELSLQHPFADPTSPPPGLLPSSLLKAVFARCCSSDYDEQHKHAQELAHQAEPHGQRPTIQLNMLVFLEAVAGMLDALLQQPLAFCLSIQQQGGTPAESAHQLRAWLPFWRQIIDNDTHELPTGLRLGFATSCQTAPTGPVADLVNREWQRITLQAFKKDWVASGNARLVPGQAAMLAQSCMKMLESVLYGSKLMLDRDRGMATPTYPAYHSREMDAFKLGATQKIIAVLENDAFLLPHGAWPCSVLDLLLSMDASNCTMLLASTKALQRLGQPLLALAADPQLWQKGPYTYHVQLLDDLCRWSGSMLGTTAGQKLAQQLVQPVAAALDALLEQIAPDERRDAAYLVETSIRVMTHLAATDHGRSHMASSGCLPRWLELAPRWRRQPAVLQRLLVLATAPFVAFGVAKHASSCLRLLDYLRYDERPGSNLLQAFRCEPAPTLLRMQVASSRTVAALAALLEAGVDPISRAILVDLLEGPVMSQDPAAMKPLVDALLAYAKATSTQPQPLQPRGNDLQAYTGHSAQPRQKTEQCTPEANQLRALNLVWSYYGQKLDGAQNSAALATGSPAPAGREAAAPVVPRILELALARLAEWLELLQEGERAAAAGGRACWECGKAVQHALTMADSLPVAALFVEQHRVLRRVSGLLPHADTNCDQEHAQQHGNIAVLALATALQITIDEVWGPGVLPWEQFQAADSSRGLPAFLARPQALGAMLRQLGHLRSQMPAGRLEAGNAAAALSILSTMAVLRLVGIVSCCWGRSGEEGQACRMVLEASRDVWGVLKGLVSTTPQFLVGVVGAVVGPWLHFLHQQLQQDGQRELQQLANKVLVDQLGEAVVQAAVERALPTLPICKTYRRRFGVAFEEAAGRAARSKAAQVDRQPGQKVESVGRKGIGGSSSGGSTGGTGAVGGATGSGAGGGTSAAAAPGGQRKDIKCGGMDTGNSPGGTTEAAVCSVCHVQPEESLLCGRCLAVRYCSKECQRADWKAHKRACRQQ